MSLACAQQSYPDSHVIATAVMDQWQLTFEHNLNEEPVIVLKKPLSQCDDSVIYEVEHSKSPPFETFVSSLQVTATLTCNSTRGSH